MFDNFSFPGIVQGSFKRWVTQMAGLLEEADIDVLTAIYPEAVVCGEARITLPLTSSRSAIEIEIATAVEVTIVSCKSSDDRKALLLFQNSLREELRETYSANLASDGPLQAILGLFEEASSSFSDLVEELDERDEGDHLNSSVAVKLDELENLVVR